jgi:hypothetical protein
LETLVKQPWEIVETKSEDDLIIVVVAHHDSKFGIYCRCGSHGSSNTSILSPSSLSSLPSSIKRCFEDTRVVIILTLEVINTTTSPSNGASEEDEKYCQELDSSTTTKRWWDRLQITTVVVTWKRT